MRRSIRRLTAIAALLIGALLPSAVGAADAYITEYANTGAIGTNLTPWAPGPAITTQDIAIGGASVQSSAFGANTRFISLTCALGCSYVISSDPTATADDTLSQQGATRLLVVAPGQKIAIIANTDGDTPGGGGAATDVNVAEWGGTATTLGQKAMAASVPVAIASDQSGIPVASRIATLSTTITRPNDAAPYTANDNFSNSTSAPTAGGFTLTSACAASGGYGTIQSAVFSSSAGTAYQGEIWVFDQAVTAVNDNAAFTVSDAEILNLVGVIPFNTTDVTAANAASYVTGLDLGYTCVGTANLRFLVKIMTGVTPAAQEVLSVRVQVQN